MNDKAKTQFLLLCLAIHKKSLKDKRNSKTLYKLLNNTFLCFQVAENSST